MKEQRARERKRGRSRRQERKNEKKNFFLFFPFFLSDTFVACVMEASIPWFLIWLAAGLDTQIFVSLLCLWSACRTLLYYTFDSIYPIGLSLSLSLLFDFCCMVSGLLLQWPGNTRKKGGKFIEARPVKKAATSAEFLFVFVPPLFDDYFWWGVRARVRL